MAEYESTGALVAMICESAIAALARERRRDRRSSRCGVIDKYVGPTGPSTKGSTGMIGPKGSLDRTVSAHGFEPCLKRGSAADARKNP